MKHMLNSTWNKLKEAVELKDVVFFGGMFMLGYGLSRISSGLGMAVVGLLLVLSIRPLVRWVK